MTSFCSHPVPSSITGLSADIVKFSPTRSLECATTQPVCASSTTGRADTTAESVAIFSVIRILPLMFLSTKMQTTTREARLAEHAHIAFRSLRHGVVGQTARRPAKPLLHT